MRVQVCVCVYVCVTGLILHSSPVHVGQLLEAGAPVVEVVIVLVPRAGGIEGADRAGGGAAALVVKHQQGVVGRSRGVVVSRPQPLKAESGNRAFSHHEGTFLSDTSELLPQHREVSSVHVRDLKRKSQVIALFCTVRLRTNAHDG